MGIPSVALSAQVDGEPQGWWTSWWDWSSFGPDALIGIGTGLIVAMIVLGTERRFAKRARGLEVSNAEAAVVAKARVALRHPIAWGSAIHDLNPDRTQLDRLVPVVGAVPTGEPSQRFPGVIHAHRAVQLLDEVESSADAVFAQQAKHETPHDLLAVSDAVLHNIDRLLREPGDLMWLWEWPEPGGWARLSPKMKRDVEDDLDLRQYMDEYVRNRRLLEAHREAFILVDGAWRADEWTATVLKTRDAPRSFWKRWRRSFAYRRSVREAMDGAEMLGYEIVSAVDNMAY
ncbi:hypothetical protein [Microbacterium sp. NPDC089696]|uniref:hypothetical protein n=1 Tax=Microbacterium sp. NPDC089696 TaxID=3364199 RepID=UPI003803627A